MGKLFRMIFFAVFASALLGCTTVGNGTMRKMEYFGCSITELDVHGDFLITVECNSDTDSCIVYVEDNLWDNIDVSYSKSGRVSIYQDGFAKPTLPQRVEISTKSNIDYVDVGGSSVITINGNRSKGVKAYISGKSFLSLLYSEIVNCEIKGNGNAKIELTGKIIDGEFYCSGASRIFADDLEIQTVKCSGSGESRVRFGTVGKCEFILSGKSSLKVGNLTGIIEGKSSGSSEIIYGGAGEAENIQVLGVSSVRRF